MSCENTLKWNWIHSIPFAKCGKWIVARSIFLNFKCSLILISSHSGNLKMNGWKLLFACFRHRNSSWCAVSVAIFWIKEEEAELRKAYITPYFEFESVFTLPSGPPNTFALPSNYRQTIIKEILDWFCFVSFRLLLFGTVIMLASYIVRFILLSA